MTFTVLVRLLCLISFFLSLVGALPLADLSMKDGEEEGDGGGWSTEEYIYLGVGILVAVLLLMCVVSYLLCECMKEIICLPFKCIKGVLCCCCD